MGHCVEKVITFITVLDQSLDKQNLSSVSDADLEMLTDVENHLGYTVDSRYLEIEGPSKTVRDIRTSTYQICSIEEKTI